MGMGEGKLFLVGECQQINIEGGKKIEKSPFGEPHSEAWWLQELSMGGWMTDEEQGVGIGFWYFSTNTHNYKGGNGDFTVKTGRYKPVQVIEVGTISDGTIWHPVPLGVVCSGEHSIIWGSSCWEYVVQIWAWRNTRWAKIRVTQVTWKSFDSLKLSKGWERGKDRGTLSQLRETWDCYVCPCWDKYLLEYTGMKGLHIHHWRPHGSGKHRRQNSWVCRPRGNKSSCNFFVCLKLF